MSLPALPHGDYAEIDHHFGRFIGGFGGGGLPAIAATMLSRAVRSGHVCITHAELSPQDDNQEETKRLTPAGWRHALKKNRAVGGPGESTPLVLDDTGRLYLRRYWEYEQSLAAAILDRCSDAPVAISHHSGDMQQVAIETAVARRFVVISGGPGTGKTTTVLKIIERLLAESGNALPRIALAAPTGKAAARLEDSLRAAAGIIQEKLPKHASTLHRLLGWRPGGFRHDSRNPLPLDVIVVDEASMVPLTMMAKLLDALPEHARVILLGDRHQLASVDPGYVLGDIADAAGEVASPLHGSLVTLEKNYRFGKQGGILELSQAVRDGDASRALEILAASPAGVVLENTPPPTHLAAKLKPAIIEGFSAYLREKDPAHALEELQKFRVLCALRSGPYGTVNINQLVEQILREEGLIPAGRHYPGLPVLITQNDYELQLFNGDIGIFTTGAGAAPEVAATHSRFACFRDDTGALRHIPAARLPAWETAFAMTIHKSQGSEYDNVLLVLPDRESPVLTRELVYTGLTRARKHVEIRANGPVLREAVQRVAKRNSGLREKLAAAG